MAAAVKVTLLVLDGVGVGAMDSADGWNTVRSVVEATGKRFRSLERMGLLAAAGAGEAHEVHASFGRARLAYEGADSYLGHQEILGTIPPTPRSDLLGESVDRVVLALRDAGHRVDAVAEGPALLVDDAVFIGDNLEAAPGQAISLIVPTQVHPFSAAVAVGEIVREAVPNTRVIVCGGTAFDVATLMDCTVRTDAGQHGVRTPSINLYDDSFEVRHLGLPVDATRQLHQRLVSHGHEVALFGKVADLADGSVGVRRPIVATDELLAALDGWDRTCAAGVAVATVQETDLAGHAQDATRLGATLELVDQWLEARLAQLRPGDVLAITADHGTDPVRGGGGHTREFAPVLWFEAGRQAIGLGERSSLGDIAATVAARFGVPWDGDGVDLFAGTPVDACGTRKDR